MGYLKDILIRFILFKKHDRGSVFQNSWGIAKIYLLKFPSVVIYILLSFQLSYSIRGLMVRVPFYDTEDCRFESHYLPNIYNSKILIEHVPGSNRGEGYETTVQILKKVKKF